MTPVSSNIKTVKNTLETWIPTVALGNRESVNKQRGRAGNAGKLSHHTWPGTGI